MAIANVPGAGGAASSAVYGATYGAAKPSPVALQAQLQRFQQQLSDCVNCASASTPQGKADIAAISARISVVQKNIAELDTGQRPQAAPAAPATGGGGTRGGLIDVYA